MTVPENSIAPGDWNKPLAGLIRAEHKILIHLNKKNLHQILNGFDFRLSAGFLEDFRRFRENPPIRHATKNRKTLMKSDL
jgi:hypothetical protein